MEAQYNTDQNIRYEAALLYANGDARGAVNLLLKRINGTNGWCDTKIWLLLLEIYQILGQQDPYEKLAVYFSNRFNFSPPSWDSLAIMKNEKGAGQWRNALVIEGSPTLIKDEKRRDYLRASKEMNSSRMDFSRLRLSEDPQQEKQELQKLLEIMQRLRKLKIPTLFMGETELIRVLQAKIEADNGVNKDSILYWDMLFEILQWRGEDKKHDDLILRFMNLYNYCPVTFDPNESIAVAPSEKEEPTQGVYTPQEIINHAEPLFLFMRQQWDKNIPAEIPLTDVKRITADTSREIAAFLQANSDEHGSHDIVFYGTGELLTALFETTGVAAYSLIRHRYPKLRNLFQPKS